MGNKEESQENQENEKETIEIDVAEDSPKKEFVKVRKIKIENEDEKKEK